MTFPLTPITAAIVSSGNIANLTTAQQANINEGTFVTTTDGRRWQYKGTGDKTLEASYILISDETPEWSVIASKPSTFPPSAHASSHGTAGSDAITPASIGAVSAIGTSAADILSVSGTDLIADDPGADRILFWDDSESKLTHLEAGTGLQISGTTLSVTGGGSTNYWIPASAFIPRTTTGCGVDSRETTTNLQNFDELLFDPATDEFAQALTILPNNYNLSTITARFYWTASTGTGAVVWGIQGRAFADDDALDTAFGTAQTVTDTLIATDDMHISSATSAVTIGGTPAANRPIQFQIYRDADAGGDTLSSDARLLGVEILFN